MIFLSFISQTVTNVLLRVKEYGLYFNYSQVILASFHLPESSVRYE